MKATPGERSAGQNEKIKTIIFTYNITDRCCMVFVDESGDKANIDNASYGNADSG